MRRNLVAMPAHRDDDPAHGVERESGFGAQTAAPSKCVYGTLLTFQVRERPGYVAIRLSEIAPGFDPLQKWLHNFRRCDEWNLCLTAGTVVPANQERQ
jgi:hypothetical protein